ncbi:hypothetical protein [Kitasatospora sp. DSM 101779]|uniref:hypothetical protein n=1 Tax=Kitasatospora sp. DSM 101779 TaxID=2853165 RepID=UPI0021DAEC31|nr:hypothetical protein [Kitasatospora sp. DSM 101779]MCU7821985.1 hypothetical protein [Kitasatospora sp. DSM 101779]
MYAIRVHLAARSGRPLRAPVEPAVRAGLERGLRGSARLSHARIRHSADALDAVVFVDAGSLLEAEDRLRDACGELVAENGELSGWELHCCEADPWIALGLHALPSRP